MNTKYRERSTGKIFTVKTTGNDSTVLVHEGEERIVANSKLASLFERV